MPAFLNFNCSKTIDCKQGAVRAVRYNGKLPFNIDICVLSFIPALQWMAATV